MAKRTHSQIVSPGPNPNNYPLWHLNSIYSDLARTICVKGLNDITDRTPLMHRLVDTFGHGVVEHCDVVQGLEGLLAYVRLQDQIEEHSGGDLRANQKAYDAISIFEGEKLACPTKNGNVIYNAISVLPAVINGMLWVSELPERISDTKLMEVMTLLGPRPQEAVVATDSAYGRKKCWGIVKYASDFSAMGVLIKARESIVATSDLPWPLVVEALAPLESTQPSFLLSLLRSERRTTAPHFVQSSAFEWEFCYRWCELSVFHRAQREALKQQHWRARHELMSDIRPFKERDRWEAGKKDAALAANRLRRTLYVMGIKPTENKASVKAVFERYGTVEKCVLMRPERGGARGMVRYSEYVDARRAKSEITAAPNVSIGTVDLVVRPMVESACLWVGELGPSVTNQQLKVAFAQFGTVRKATVAISAASRASLGYGVVEYVKHSVASDVLATMEKEIFVMEGSSKPVRVEPYACSNKRWSTKSPADDLLKELNARIVSHTETAFAHCLKARELQYEHRSEEQTLRMFQRQERRKTEEEQQRRLHDEEAKLLKLKEMLAHASRTEDDKHADGMAVARPQPAPVVVKRWWHGEIFCAFTDTVITDLLETYHIPLDQAYHKQVLCFPVNVTAEKDETARQNVWSVDESTLQTKGLVPHATAIEHVSIVSQHPYPSGVVAWHLSSPPSSPNRAAFERFRHFLFEYQLAAVLKDDPECRVYMVSGCQQFAPTPADAILAISIH